MEAPRHGVFDVNVGKLAAGTSPRYVHAACQTVAYFDVTQVSCSRRLVGGLQVSRYNGNQWPYWGLRAAPAIETNEIPGCFLVDDTLH